MHSVTSKKSFIICAAAVVLAAFAPVHAEAAEAVRNHTGGRFMLQVGGQENGLVHSAEGAQGSRVAPNTLTGQGAAQGATATTPVQAGAPAAPPVTSPVKDKIKQ